ncbi:MAG: hypothetical protein U0234_07945 [Sandaracinus sp.]
MRAALVSIALVVALSVAGLCAAGLAPAPIVAQDTGTAAPAGCEIRGRVTLAALHEAGPTTPLRVTRLEDRAVALVPRAHGVWYVRALDGEPVEGTTSEPIELVLTRRLVVGPASFLAGVRVERLRPVGGALEGELVLADGARATRVHLGCDDLGTRTRDAMSTAEGLGTGQPSPGPRWQVRTSRLFVRTRPETGAERVDLRLADRTTITWIERERREGWVRVEGRFRDAVVAGWIVDTDLAPR